jgi:hypothetical protein
VDGFRRKKSSKIGGERERERERERGLILLDHKDISGLINLTSRFYPRKF